MKVVVFCNNHKSEGNKKTVGWYLVADSAISNSGKPFFVPDEEKVEGRLSMAVRISRLGKSISPRFAHRYYHEIAPAVHFQLPERLELLQRDSLPISPAVSFDRSVMADFYQETEELRNINLSMRLNGQEVLSLSQEDFLRPVDELISEFSKTNTLKIGDVLLPCLSPAVKVDIGDYLEIIFNGSVMFTVKIK